MKRRLFGPKSRIAILLALGAGFGVLQIQPKDAPVRMLVIAFLAASLPVLAMHWTHNGAKAKTPEQPK